MANYYTQCSFIYGPHSIEDINFALTTIHKLKEDDPLDDELKHILGDFESLTFNCVHNDENCLWFSTDESANTDQIAHFLQYLMQKRNLPPVGFEVSYTCDKPRLDAFGGCALWITADEIQFMSTHAWLEEKARAYNDQMRVSNI